jgi:hypothetical protein
MQFAGDIPMPRPQPGAPPKDQPVPVRWKDGEGRDYTLIQYPDFKVVQVSDKNKVLYSFGPGGRQFIIIDNATYWWNPGENGKVEKVVFQVKTKDSFPFVGNWVKKGDQWVLMLGNKEQRTYKGKYTPDQWPELLWNKDKIVKIAEASEKSNADIRQAIGMAWKETFDDSGLNALSLPAKALGLGLSTGPNKLQNLVDQANAIDKLHTELKLTIKNLKAADDPESIAELTEKFIKQDNELRGKLQTFAADSKPVLKNTQFIATVHGIAGDVYSLGGRSIYGNSTIANVWQRGGALKDVYGLGKGIYKLELQWEGGDPKSALNQLPPTGK